MNYITKLREFGGL